VGSERAENQAMGTVRLALAAVVLALAAGAATHVRAADDVGYWSQQLGSSDPEARAAAARGLALSGNEAAVAVPQLVEALRDENADVRRAVIEALMSIGRPADVAAKPLAQALGRDTHPDVRRAAQRALERMGSRASAAVPELVDALAAEDPAVRRAVIGVIGAVGVRTQAVERSLARVLVADDEPRVRSAARDALSTLGRPLASLAPELVAALDDPEPRVRRNASSWLAQLDAPPAGAVTKLVDIVARDDDADVRDAAGDALKAYGPEGGANAALVEVLASAASDAREKAAEVLGAIGGAGDRELVALAKSSLRDEDLAVRLASRGALVKLARTQAGVMDELMALGQRADIDADVRAGCVDAVGRLSEAAAPVVPQLIGSLREGPEVVREAAARALGRVGADAAEAIPALKQAEAWDRSQDVRDAAGKAARHIRDVAVASGRGLAPALPDGSSAPGAEQR